MKRVLLLFSGLAALALVLVPRLPGESRHPNQEPVILVRRGPGHWQMQQPYVAVANDYIELSLRELLRAESSARYPANELDLTAVGLTVPVATLRIDHNGTEAITLLLGGTDPVHGNRYLQVGDSVSLIADHLTFSLTSSATELLSRALLPEPLPSSGAALSGIDLPALPAEPADDDGPGVAAVPARSLRQTAGAWTLQSTPTPASTPAPTPASTPALPNDALVALVREWTTAEAQDIKPLDAKPLNSTTPIGSIRLTRGQDVLQFEVMALRPRLILARPDIGIAYRLSTEQARRLLRPETWLPTAPPAPSAEPQDGGGEAPTRAGPELPPPL